MPLREIREVYPHVYLGLWEITESLAELSQSLKTLTKNINLPIPIFTSTARQRQWLGSRVLAYALLQKLSPEPVLLQNNNSGKPEFQNSSYRVSISHSHHLAAVILSQNYEVGIDIEIISPKVMRVRNKFMTEAEKNNAAEDVEKALIYWSGKETLYKLYSQKQLIFKENLFISPFNKLPAGTTGAQIVTSDFNKRYTLHYEILNQHILTYTLDF